MKRCFFALSAIAIVGFANGQVVNGSFETTAAGGPNSTLVNSDGSNQTGLSGADGWSTFLYSAGVLDTNQVPAGTQAPLLAGQGNFMLYVSNSGATGGIYQDPNLPAGTTYTAYVYVVSGEVALQSFDGNYDTSAIATATGAWQQLSITTTFDGASILIGTDNFNSGAVSSGPSQYYVDLVEAQAVPEPASLAVLAIGIVALIARKRSN